MENVMTMAYGKFKREKARSPSSLGAIKAAIAASPHADLVPPPDPQIAEDARRAEVSNEARVLFHDGLLAHEILEHYPDEPWMADKIGEWEVVYRREQIQFVEGMDKPAPTFTPPAPKAPVGDVLELPVLAIDKPHLKAVAIRVEVCCNKTGEVCEEMVWFPRSQIKDGTVPKWLVGKKREELDKKYPKAIIEGLPG